MICFGGRGTGPFSPRQHSSLARPAHHLSSCALPCSCPEVALVHCSTALLSPSSSTLSPAQPMLQCNAVKTRPHMPRLDTSDSRRYFADPNALPPAASLVPGSSQACLPTPASTNYVSPHHATAATESTQAPRHPTSNTQYGGAVAVASPNSFLAAKCACHIAPPPASTRARQSSRPQCSHPSSHPNPSQLAKAPSYWLRGQNGATRHSQEEGQTGRKQGQPQGRRRSQPASP